MHVFRSIMAHLVPIHPMVVAAALLPGAGLAQQVQHHLYTLRGDATGDSFGTVTGVGDIDRDGHADFCVGAAGANSNKGYTRVFSGATGKVLRTVHGDTSGDRFGHAVRNAGDVNKDGVPDIVVGAPGQSTTKGYVRVISGLWVFKSAGSQVLHTFQGKANGDEYGISVSDAGDVDKDGYADVLVGARQPGRGSGYAEVRSGRTGNLLHTYPGGSGFRLFGRSVSNAGDPNQDGCPDAIIGGSYLWRVLSGKDGSLIRQSKNQGGYSVSGTGDVNMDGYDDVSVWDGNTRRVHLFSGKDWTVLYSFNASLSPSRESTRVSRAGDVNQDGYPDVIALGDPTYPVGVYSGRDGRPLLQLKLTNNSPGNSVSAAGDVNGDGVPDVLVGDPPGGSAKPGVAYVFSGAKLGLASDTHQASITQGGGQSLSLDAGTTNANRSYWIFGSVTGTTPGLTLESAIGAVDIPLNPDIWTHYTIALANSSLLTKTNATLDASGTAQASFNIPKSNITSLIGLVFHQAYLVYDTNNNFYMASNAVPLTLVR